VVDGDGRKRQKSPKSPEELGCGTELLIGSHPRSLQLPISQAVAALPTTQL
jgi:hypothetical protein